LREGVEELPNLVLRRRPQPVSRGLWAKAAVNGLLHTRFERGVYRRSSTRQGRGVELNGLRAICIMCRNCSIEPYDATADRSLVTRLTGPWYSFLRLQPLGKPLLSVVLNNEQVLLEHTLRRLKDGLGSKGPGRDDGNWWQAPKE